MYFNWMQWINTSSKGLHVTSFYQFSVNGLDILHVSFDILGFRHAMTMAFAVEEINKNSDLLPNVTLGYRLYDNCGALVVGFSGALSLASGQEAEFFLQDGCAGSPPVLGIVGDSPSTFTIASASVLGLYQMPMVRDW